jgi:hypothetical protein
MAKAIMAGIVNTENAGGLLRLFLNVSFLGNDVPDGFQNYNVPVDIDGTETVQQIRQKWTAAIENQAIVAGYSVTSPEIYLTALEKGA